LADEEQRECTDNEFPIWCPLEEIDKSIW